MTTQKNHTGSSEHDESKALPLGDAVSYLDWILNCPEIDSNNLGNIECWRWRTLTAESDLGYYYHPTENSAINKLMSFAREKHVKFLHEHTGRDVIVYMSTTKHYRGDMLSECSISDNDVDGLLEVCKGLTGNKLDLIVNSCGGDPVATEQLVEILLSRYSHIRVFVPGKSFSAATVLSSVANEIFFDNHSCLGPTDPQISMNMYERKSAFVLLDELYKKVLNSKATDTSLTLNDMGDLLVYARHSLAYSKSLVNNILKQRMFANQGVKTEEMSREVSDWLSNVNVHKTHDANINYDMLIKKGVAIYNLSERSDLHRLINAVFDTTYNELRMTSMSKLWASNSKRKVSINYQRKPHQAGLVFTSPNSGHYAVNNSDLTSFQIIGNARKINQGVIQFDCSTDIRKENCLCDTDQTYFLYGWFFCPCLGILIDESTGGLIAEFSMLISHHKSIKQKGWVFRDELFNYFQGLTTRDDLYNIIHMHTTAVLEDINAQGCRLRHEDLYTSLHRMLDEAYQYYPDFNWDFIRELTDVVDNPGNILFKSILFAAEGKLGSSGL